MRRRVRTKLLHARVTPAIKDRLDKFLETDALGRSESDIIREAVLRYLEQLEKPTPENRIPLPQR